MKITDVKVGMKVRFTDKFLHEIAPQYYPEVGTIGEVTDIEVMVQWPKGSTSRDDNWFVPTSAIEPVKDSKPRSKPKKEAEWVNYNPKNSIHIYQCVSNPREVIAEREGGKVHEMAKAVCGSDDVFDFGTGAKLALERLLAGEREPEKKGWNGKIVCTSTCSESEFKVGHVYEVKDGQIIDEIAKKGHGPIPSRWLDKHGLYIENEDRIKALEKLGILSEFVVLKED